MKIMSRIAILIIAATFIIGCGATTQRSEFFQHDTMYKNWDHLRYSWGGYKYQDTGVEEKSNKQTWWGLPVEDGMVQ